MSLVSAATEIAFALGQGDGVVGVSHECDHPAAVARLPRVTHALVDATASSAAIDAAVRGVLAQGGGNAELYHVDADALLVLRPDVILTQRLCDVCAVAVGALERATAARAGARVVTLAGHDLAGVYDDIRLVAEACDADAGPLLDGLDARRAAVRHSVAGRARPTVVCLEWLDPPFDAGHWVPEQIAEAGGHERLARPGTPSRSRSWDEVAAADPDVLLCMPCGFGIDRAADEGRALVRDGALRELRAVRDGRAWAVDGNALFSRPGPRLVDGIELVASLLHPDAFASPSASAARAL